MASYAIYEPPGTAPASFKASETAVLVKDGFSLAAFLIPFVWLLYRRMWLPFLLWLAMVVAMLFGFRLAGTPDWLTGLLQLMFAWLFAAEANALRGWSLRSKGWRLAGVARGDSLAEAEIRYLAGIDPVEPPAPPLPNAGRHEVVADMFSGPWSGQGPWEPQR